jgi:carbonic anhydrase
MASREIVSRTSASRSSFFKEHAPLFDRLVSEGQSPDTVFIGCDDARVIPGGVTGAKPGDLFVLRNLANVVPPHGGGERAVGATLEYAVRHLKVNHSILCGHTDCGGIKALDAQLDPLREPNLSRWIEYARPAQTQVDARGVDPDARHRAIVERSILQRHTPNPAWLVA